MRHTSPKVSGKGAHRVGFHPTIPTSGESPTHSANTVAEKFPPSEFWAVDGLHGNNQISGEDTRCSLEARRV